MHADGRNQQHGRAERTCHRDEVDDFHRAVESCESLLERDREQETGEQLDAGLRHLQFLQQARPIAVQLGFRLVAVRIPRLSASGCSMSTTPILTGVLGLMA